MNPLDIFIPILINPLINVLLAFYQLALNLNLPGPLGWSIIFLTIAINFLVYPLKSAQLRSQRKLQELRPHLAELKRRHGHDKKRHQEEQLKLYREHGYNPAAGCLPLLIQLPILFGLYAVLINILGNGQEAALGHLNGAAYFDWLKINNLETNFLGLNLAITPSKVDLTATLVLVIAVTALLQLVLGKMTQPPPAPKEEKKTESFEDALAASSSSMLYLLPAIIAWAAYSLPIGLALYWNVSSIFAIIQQYLIVGLGGLASWRPRKS